MKRYKLLEHYINRDKGFTANLYRAYRPSGQEMKAIICFTGGKNGSTDLRHRERRIA